MLFTMLSIMNRVILYTSKYDLDYTSTDLLISIATWCIDFVE